jgi:hypothetical protein
VNGTPITSIAQGQTFELRVFVRDLRADDGDGDPNTDRRVVYAAYADLLYGAQLVTPLGTVNHVTPYIAQKSGDLSIPGIMNELGAFSEKLTPPSSGGDPALVARIPMRALAVGTAKFRSDPADNLPLNDTLLYEPPGPVGYEKISFGSADLTITNAGAGGEGGLGRHNGRSPADVNDDGDVAPLDALLVIRDLNAYGARPLTPRQPGDLFLDVVQDDLITPLDALWVINVLNHGGGARGAGEGEAASTASSSQAGLDSSLQRLNSSPTSSELTRIATVATGPVRNAATASVPSSTSSPVRTAAVDRVLAGANVVKDQVASYRDLVSVSLANSNAVADDLVNDLAIDVAKRLGS